jgi:hypothetical protein
VLTPIFVLAARPAISRRRPWSGSSERRVRRFAAFVRPVLAKVQALLTEAVLGAAATAGADGPLAALGLTKPADWSAADRTNDILPHLGYGAAAYAMLRALDNYT